MPQTISTGHDYPGTGPSAGHPVSRAMLGERLSRLRITLRDLQGLHWTHWLVVGLTLAATLGAAQSVRQRNQEIGEFRFTRETEIVIDQFNKQLKRYEDVLWGGVAAIHARRLNVERDEWASYTKSLRLEERYPAISRLGLIRSVPETELAAFVAEQRLSDPGYEVFPPVHSSLHYPVQYIEPSSEGSGPPGLDGAAESHRKSAIERARDSGQAQISEPIVLGMEDDGIVRSAAVAVYVPFYARHEVPAAAERARLFEGAVAAPIELRSMLRSGNGRKKYVAFKVWDGDSQLLDDPPEDWQWHDDEPLYTLTKTLEMWGRPWTFEFKSTQRFRADAVDHQPLIILAGGSGITALLMTLFIVLTRANRKTTHYITRLSQLSTGLRNKADALEDSNAELERFACVVAHDLKSPLGSISLLCDCIDEDLDGSPVADQIPPEVVGNLKRVQLQIVRMRELIDDIMLYSSDVGATRAMDNVDTRQLIMEIGESLKLAPGELTVVGRLPELQTSRIQLQQVLENLIGNAFKYHPVREEARVRVWVDDLGEFLRFSVRDNGAGIDSRFHESVFEMFQTVPSNTRVDSTGVGLAIVKRAVTSMGGEVGIDSAPGKGATFRFTWPVSREQETTEPAAPTGWVAAAAAENNDGILPHAA